MNKVCKLLVLAIVLTCISGCADVKRIANSLTNISKLVFSLEGISNMTIEGIDVSNLRTIKDFKVMDAMKIANAYRNKSLNTSFNVNVKAENPNGTAQGQKNIPATIENLAWDLFIDDSKTVSGDLASPVKVPGGGAEQIIPLRINMDLVSFFGNRGYDELIDLALSIGGIKKEPSRVMLKAKPTVSTSFGPITYPGSIDIEHEF
jgi:hypothetical protein